MVVNRSLRKELLREIRNSRTRFLSIFLMVALGVMFLVGLRSAAPDMRTTADGYFDRAGLFDVQILSTLGLTKADIAVFAQTEGVESARGGWSLDAVLSREETQRIVKVISLTGGMNRPDLLAGRMPEQPSECAVDAGVMDGAGLKIGDRVTLAPGENMSDALRCRSFTITARVNSPLYISLDRGTGSLGDGSVAGFVLLPESSFDLEYYTAAYITADGVLPLSAYGDDYDGAVKTLTDRLENTAESRGVLRYDLLRSEAQEKIDNAQQELDDGRAEADREIADAQQKLDDARQELDDGWAELAQAKQDYDDGVIEGQQELDDARQELDDGWAELAQAKQDYDDGVIEGQEKLDDARWELDSGWYGLYTAQTTLEQSQAELDARRTEAEAGLEAARQALEDSQTLLDEKQPELDAAQAQVEALRTQTEEYAAGLEAQNAQIAAAEAAGTPLDPASLPLDQQTLEAMQAGLAQAETALADAQAEYDAGRAELEAGWAAYEAQKDEVLGQLDDAQAQIDSGWQDYESGWASLNAAEAEYTQGVADYEQGLADAAQKIADGEQELLDGEADYAQGQSDYEAGLADAAQEIADGEQELLDGEAEYADGEQELADARQEAEDQIAEGQEKIDEAREALGNLKPAEVYVLDRNSNYGFVSYDQNAARMENLARVFPVIFFIVAALVCLTTMTRMVEEQRTQIGTIKAMGYGTGAIAAKFIIYGVTAALGGAVLGAAVGTTLIPWVIFTSYGIMYTLPALQIRIYWGLILIAGAAGVACTVGATLWAMLSTARLSPAALMRPRAPRAGKRILLERVGPVWKRMSFSMKVSARNLFRYKKRLWMTVIGVAGCTALLIAGLGLRSSIFDIIDIQFGEIYRYDVQVSADPEVPGTTDRVERYLEQSAGTEAWAGANTRSVTFQAGGAAADGYLRVTDDREALDRQIDFRDMSDKTHLRIPEDGILIDVKLAELLKVGVGDTVTIDCGSRISVPVGGIMEHYVYHYACMDAETFSRLTGEEYAPNEYFLTVTDDSDGAVSGLCGDLLELDGVQSASNLKSMARSFRETMEVVDAAVMIIILSAAALALVVLYNLTNINITERIRELATIKVLGFYDAEVAMYIYRENIVLTLMGIALGQFFGKFLCTWLVRTIEMDIVMFGREAKPENYVLSVVLSLLFAVLVNILMYFRMRKIDMVQSLKSVE